MTSQRRRTLGSIIWIRTRRERCRPTSCLSVPRAISTKPPCQPARPNPRKRRKKLRRKRFLSCLRDAIRCIDYRGIDGLLIIFDIQSDIAKVVLSWRRLGQGASPCKHHKILMISFGVWYTTHGVRRRNGRLRGGDDRMGSNKIGQNRILINKGRWGAQGLLSA